MKVISLLQPWATLVVIGAKKIETRSFNTKYRGPLLIHASKSRATKNFIIASSEPFKSFLPQYDSEFITGQEKAIGSSTDWNALPFGAIIGQVNIISTKPSTIFEQAYLGKTLAQFNLTEEDWLRERVFGNYEFGRYGWLLTEAVQFAQPIPAKGQLGFWNYDMPDHIHVPVPGGGHATFSSPPSKELLKAVNTMAEVVHKKWKTK